MSIRNFILNRFSKVDSDGVRNSSRRIPVRRISSNSKWKPVVELQVCNDILEGTQKMKVIPYEKSYNESRSHQSL
jgi:hypothetical protein